MATQYKTGDLRKAFSAISTDSNLALPTDKDKQPSKDKKLDELRHTLSLGEGAERAGLMPTSYEPQSSYKEQQKQKREKEFASVLHQLQMARLQLMQELNDLQNAIEKLTHEIENRSRNIESLDNYLRDFTLHRKFDVGKDGYPIDVRLKVLILQWEKDNLRKWDCFEGEEAFEILNGIKREQEADKLKFESCRTEMQTEWTDKNAQLETLDETITQIEQHGMDAGSIEEAISVIGLAKKSDESNNIHKNEQTQSVKLDNPKL